MPTLYIMCGIPGSGKSTIATNIPRSMWDGNLMNVVESDQYRKLLLTEQGYAVVHQHFLTNEEMSLKDKRRIEDKVWLGVKEGIIDAFNMKADVVIDATNTEQWVLEDWFKLANEYEYKPKVIIMSTPLDVCIERNSNREQPVPEGIMSVMYNSFIMSLGWLYLNHNEKIINSAHL